MSPSPFPQNQILVKKKIVLSVQDRQINHPGNPPGPPPPTPPPSSSTDLRIPHQGETRGTAKSEEGDFDCDFMEDEGLHEEDETCMPDQAPTGSSPQSTIQYEYHVLYSQSYSVPVLFINVLNSSGKRLSLDQVWEMCPDTFQPHLHENKWTTLTQQEHPLLGIPFLMLHPCHTADLMTQVGKGVTSESSRNYLLTWLSAVGPLVGLNMSERYALSLGKAMENS